MSAEALNPNYVSSNNLYRQTLLGNRGTVANCASSIKAIGTNTRFANSAGTKNTVKEHISSETTFTKFRPVTSHPTTSLIASLYKHHSNGDQRTIQSASGGKLPTLYNQKPSQNSHKRKRELRSFNTHRNPQTDFSLPQGILISRKQHDPRNGPAVIVPSASASWTAAHASISASGQRLLPETNSQNTPFTNGLHNSIDGYKSMQTYSSSSKRPSVNYMPFYEVRGRGDGASVVDAPSIDIEGKKIEGSKHSQKSTDDGSSRKELSTKTEETSVTQPSISSTMPLEEGMESLVSVLLGKNVNETSQGNSTPTSHKIEKKVRFSSAVTTNKIDEPSYTETLIQSLQRDLKKRSNYDLSTNSPCVSEESKDEKTASKEQADSVVASCSEKDDEKAYITPVMKVIVTKRQAPTGAEIKDGSKTTNNSTRTLNLPDKIVNTSSDLIQPDFKATHLSASEVIRRGTRATVRASTAGIARNPEAIARVVKMVPKRQTVVMPNFPKQPAWQRRNFPLHSNNPRLGAAVIVNQPCAVAIQGSNFNRNQISKLTTQRKSENLRSRLTSAGGGIYISTSQSMRPSTTPGVMNEFANKDRLTAPRSGQQNTVRVKDEPNKTIALLSPRNLPNYNSNTLFTDFQPIPSMPDHINFCDPRKTELILQWLNDVNKKRNIEDKLRKGSFSVRSKAST